MLAIIYTRTDPSESQDGRAQVSPKQAARQTPWWSAWHQHKVEAICIDTEHHAQSASMRISPTADPWNLTD